MESAEAQLDVETQEKLPAANLHGKRILVPLAVEYDFTFLCERAKSVVPAPLWPDPDKEPLPPHVVH